MQYYHLMTCSRYLDDPAYKGKPWKVVKEGLEYLRSQEDPTMNVLDELDSMGCFYTIMVAEDVTNDGRKYKTVYYDIAIVMEDEVSSLMNLVFDHGLSRINI